MNVKYLLCQDFFKFENTPIYLWSSSSTNLLMNQQASCICLRCIIILIKANFKRTESIYILKFPIAFVFEANEIARAC